MEFRENRKGVLIIDWKKEAERLKYEKGLSNKQIAGILTNNYSELNKYDLVSLTYKVRDHIRTTDKYKAEKNNNNFKSNESIKDDIIKLLYKGTTIIEATDTLDITEETFHKEINNVKKLGYFVKTNGDTYIIPKTVLPSNKIYKSSWGGERIIRFGLLGDTQFNSIYTQITMLHGLYDFYARENIEEVFHTGDIDEGEKMRPGHEYELYNHGADKHVDEIVKNYPRRKGITTRFITGNHDHAYIKLAGIDIGYKIEEKRNDMIYLGRSSAVMQLTDNCTLELRHPIDGTAYAISYKIQKMVEAMSGGEKPSILAVGHYHKYDNMFYRNVHTVQTACVQAQTNWMRGKSISAFVGGCLVEIHVDDSGIIKRFKIEFIPQYVSIQDDYKNWR